MVNVSYKSIFTVWFAMLIVGVIPTIISSVTGQQTGYYEIVKQLIEKLA